MLSRHFKTFQVKCNFCLEWMSISSELKFNINICNQCLHLGCQQKTLKAVSSSGQIYQLSILKQDSMPDLNFSKNIVQNDFNQTKQQQRINQPQKIEKPPSFKPSDEEQNTKNSEIMLKWNIISSFINQKDFLSTEEIGYLKILISERPEDLKRVNDQIMLKVQSLQPMQQLTSEFDNQQNWLKIPKLISNKIDDSVSNFENVQLKTQNSKREKQQILNKTGLKQKQNLSRTKGQLTPRSPSKVALGEKDLNRNYGSHCKISELKLNNYTSSKKVKISFYDDCRSSLSSRVSTSIFLAQTSSRLAFGSSVFRGIPKLLNSEQLKNFEQIKNRILKYLEKNYESQPLARLMLSIVFEAYKNTSIIGKSIELVSYDLSYTDFRCYLEAFDWTGIEVLKLVNTKLGDQQMKTLRDFMITNNLPIKVLVLTSNKLTQTSVQCLTEQNLPTVKQIYLGKNYINKGKVRAQTIALQNKYSLYL